MPERPNILFILADDQGPWAMRCAGTPELRTPNLDRLAATGLRLDSLFCASPVCSPARASILTGRIPSQHGVHDWLAQGNSTVEGDGLIEYLAGQPGYTDHLAAAGYDCGISGKYHLGDTHHPQKGFTFWEVHTKGGGPYVNPPMVVDGEPRDVPGYVTDIITDNALRFLEQQSGQPEPFYLSVHYTAPHSPWSRDQHPAELWDEYHDTCSFGSIPRVAMHPWIVSPTWFPRGEEARRSQLSGYFAAITAMDTSIGRLLDWLEEHGRRESTLVVFTSDNGMSMGHHGIFGKGNGTFPLNMYDSAVKVPGLVSQPGTVPQGRVASSLLSHLDLFPTLLEHVGLPDPEADSRPGRSFAPLLRGEPLAERESLVVHDEYGPVRMIRTREWKYVHRYPYGPHELYDLVSDPDETRNLVPDPAMAGRIREMRAGLEEWFAQYVDPAVDGAREGVMGGGQNRPAGLRAPGEDTYNRNWPEAWPPYLGAAGVRE